MRISDWSSDVCSSDLAAGTGLDLGLAERQHGRANIGEPQNRAGMCDAEWIEDAGLHRHLAADLIGGLRRDDEADIASDLHCGSPKAWAALHHFIAGKKRAAQVFHLLRCIGTA